jgi:hypothetical protein
MNLYIIWNFLYGLSKKLGYLHEMFMIFQINGDYNFK